MSATVGELLEARAGGGVVGRRPEFAVLLSLLDTDGPLVVFVHGLGGIGTSSLVRAFCRESRRRGAMAEGSPGLWKAATRGYRYILEADDRSGAGCLALASLRPQRRTATASARR